MTFKVIKSYQKISNDKKIMLFKKHLEFNYMSQMHLKDKIILKDYYNIYQKLKPKVTSNNLRKALFQTVPIKNLNPKQPCLNTMKKTIIIR